MIYKYYNNSLKSLRCKEAGAILIFIFLALHLTIESSSLYAQSNNPKIFIGYKNDLLSISTKDADLREVLLKLSDKTNIKVKLPVNINKKITINKNGISLAQGLEYILKDLNHIILYSGIKNNRLMISRVIVFSGSKKSTKLTDSETQAAGSEIQLPDNEMQTVDIIKGYEKQIEIMKKKLSTIAENSRRRKQYINRIKRLEKFIEHYESRAPN
jgi:hypothetical protein